MKIAMIGLRGIPSRDGGVEVAVGELAPRLVSLGLDITVYTRKSYQNSQLDTYLRVKLINFPTINTKHLEAIFHTFISTIHAIINRYDIIHFHAVGNALFSWIPRIFGIKTVVTIHGQDWQRDKWNNIAKIILRIGEWCAVNCPNITISVSKKIFNIYSNKKIIYIPNGYSIAKEVGNSDVLKRFKINKYILFLSRLVPEKGIHLLIEAYKKIDTDFQLVIVGGGTHTNEYIDRLYKSASGFNIIFTGPLFDTDKTIIFKNAKLFVLPSNLEGMPIVLLEAMSFGIPCLVSDIPEIIDVVRNEDNDLAYIFMSNNVNDLSKKLHFALNDDKLNVIGDVAKKIIIKKYSWDEISKDYLKLYKSL